MKYSFFAILHSLLILFLLSHVDTLAAEKAVFGTQPSSTIQVEKETDKEPFTPDADKKAIKDESKQVNGLPNVFIIGDSISIGYTPHVIKGLRGKANVKRAKANCGDTNRGIESLKQWLGDTKWDVIHFNFGLHDLCYRHPDAKVYGKRDKIKGTISVPLEQYEKNLEQIVEQLKATKAKLIWASTTLVPEGEAGRIVGDDLKYNAVAAKVMKKHNIKMNDLHALTAAFDKNLFTKPGDVHFKKEGSKKLGDAVVSAILQSL